MLITKSLYLEYLDCPKNAWLKLYKSDELQEYFKQTEDEKRREWQGNIVEQYARQLFSRGVYIEQCRESYDVTQAHVRRKTPVLFQPTFVHDVFLARSDILEYDSAHDAWNLYEVKSTKFPDGDKESKSSYEKKLHIEDIAFQYVVLQQWGMNIRGIFLICMSRNTVSTSPLDVASPFTITDVTAPVINRQQQVAYRMSCAQDELCNKSENKVSCKCLYRGRSSHCKTFSYSYPCVPVYSVHDLYRIGTSREKLRELIDAGILCIDEIPA